MMQDLSPLHRGQLSQVLRREGLALLTATQGKKCTEASFTTEGIRLMKHKISILLQLKQKSLFACNYTSMKTRKIRFSFEERKLARIV